MIGYALRRLAQLIPILFGVSVATFLLLHAIPGDPAVIVAGAGATNAEIDALRKSMGLDDSLLAQYGHYVANVVTGNFGNSFVTHLPVGPELLSRFLFTLRLSVVAMAGAVIIGIVAGVSAALRSGRTSDLIITAISMLGLAMPGFWLGLMLLELFAAKLRWLPAGGSGSWANIVLPAFVLATSGAAIIARMTRASMLGTLGQDYIRTLAAAGVERWRIVYQHALRNALNPVITVAGLQFGFLLAGVVVIEVVFTLPGVGNMIVMAIFARDYPIVQGGLLLLATTVVVVNLLTDLAYAVANPRIRYGRT